jgi:group I intron endonuclease
MSIGIYKITNLLNNKVYIGQSWNIEKRWINHKCSKTKDYFSRALKKYGTDNFTFEIIREIKEGKLTQILLDCLEEKYIKQFNSIDRSKGYNLRTGGNGGGKHSSETKNLLSRINYERFSNPKEIEKLRKAHIGKKQSLITIEKRKKALKGRIVSDKTRKKISKSNTGKVCSEEAKEKNRLWHLGKKPTKESKEKAAKIHCKKVRCIETGIIYDSIGKACLESGANRDGIGLCCKGKIKTSGKLHWEFYNSPTNKEEEV